MSISRIWKPPLGAQLNRGHVLAKGLVGCFLFNEGGNLPQDLVNRGLTINGVNFSWTTGPDGIVGALASGDVGVVGFPSFGPAMSIVSRFFRTNTNNFVIAERETVNTTFLLWSPGGTGIEWRGGSGAGRVSVGSGFNAGVWYQVAVTDDGTTNANAAKLYQNGLLVAQNNGGAVPAASTTKLHMGAYDGSGAAFDGKFGFVYIYDRALSPEEVAWLYAQPYGIIKTQPSPVKSTPGFFPGTAALVYTGATPTLSFSGDITLTPAAGTITYTGATPTLSFSGSFSLAPAAGAIAYTGAAASLSLTIDLSPAVANIRYTGANAFLSLVRTVGTGDQLFIGDTQFEWHESTFRITKTLSGNWSAEFDIDYYGGTMPTVGQSVAFFLQSVKRFGGLVQSVKEDMDLAAPGHSVLHVKVGGYQLLTDRVIIAKLFTLFLGGTSGITVYNIWQEKLAQFGVTKVGDAPSTVIGEQLFHYITVTEAFNRIKAQDPGYDWWIDDDLLLHYESTDPAGGPNAPFSIADGDGNVEFMAVTTSDVRFRNRQWVLPSADVHALRDDTATGDGATTAFPTVYVVNVKPIVRVNGVDQVVTELGNWITGWQVYYIPGGIGVFFASPPAAAAAIDILYPNPWPLAFSAEDPASIAAVGLYEAVWQAKNVFDAATAGDEAQGLLDLYSQGGFPKAIELHYNDHAQGTAKNQWLTPGMILAISHTFPTASGNFTVESVTSQEIELTVWKHVVMLRAGLGDVTDAQALEQFRISARVPIDSPPYRMTAELFVDQPGSANAGAQTGIVANRFVVQTQGTIYSWDILSTSPPTGDDFTMDILLNGVSIFASAVKVTAAIGITTLQSGIDFLTNNIKVVYGDIIAMNVLQVGSGSPGKNFTFHLNIKVTPNVGQ